jgi:hypothetical protein
MALTEASIPKYVSLTGRKNPVAIKLETDNYIVTPGEKASDFLEFTGDPAENETITINFLTSSLIFTFKDNPDDSGLQLQTNKISLGLNTGQWVIEYFIKKGLLANHYINENYNLSVFTSSSTGALLYFEAKEAGEAYDYSITSACANFSVWVSHVDGVDMVAQPNFTIINDLFVEDTFNSGAYKKAISQGAAPDENFQAEFRIEGVLKGFLSPEPPTFNQAAITQCSKMCKRYKYRFAESYGATPTIKKYSPAVAYIYNTYPNPPFVDIEESAELHWALLAQLPFTDFPSNTFNEDYILHHTTRKFLTSQPAVKKISEAQQEYLFYFNHQGSGTLTLWAKIYFSDSTTTEQQMLSKVDIIQQVYIFPAGYTQVGIDDVNPAKTVTKYELYAKHLETGYTSERRTYILDRNYYRNNNYFLFLNRLGGFDTIWCRGEVEKKGVYERDFFSRILPTAYANSDAETESLSNGNNFEYVFNTGWISLDYLNYMDEFFDTTRIYKIESDFFQRMNMLGKDQEFYDTADINKPAHQFKLTNAFKG